MVLQIASLHPFLKASKVKLYILFKSQDLENISGSVAHTRIGQIRECPTPPRGWTIHSNVCRSSSTAFYNKNMYMFRFIFVSNALKRRKAVVNLYESECLGFNLIKINAFSCCEKIVNLGKFREYSSKIARRSPTS